MTVVTGVSGSGKSSLARDTLFAEGQRRYLESVSIQTSQMLRSLQRPDVDEISGLPPTINLDQRSGLAPLRSTVAVTTDLYDYLRLLYARCGVVHCPNCTRPVQSQTIDEITTRVQGFTERTKFMLLAPLVRQRRGAHREIIERIGRNGLVRVRVDGDLYDLSEVENLDESKLHDIDAVVDRLILKDGMEARLRESIALCVRESGDACIVCTQDDGQWVDHYFNTRHSCGNCSVSFPEPDPGMFSFNSARGACASCEGRGVEGTVENSGEITVFHQQPCSACAGTRLQPVPSSVRFGQKTVAEFCRHTVTEALQLVTDWLQCLQQSDGAPDEFHVRPEGVEAALRLLPDVERRLSSLCRVGLDYLTLDRASRTLSGGEYQRTRLAGCLGSDIHGACYLLDEPTNGLHPRDTQRLLKNLFALRDAQATVVLVEHDPDVIRAADHLIDIGPGPGSDGGKVTYTGVPSGVLPDSATGQALFDQTLETEVATARVLPDDGCVTITGAQLHNLANVTVDIPLRQMVCCAGPSGSGKTSLMLGTLVPVLNAVCNDDIDPKTALADARCSAISGYERIGRVVMIDGRPLSRNRRSCLATYSGIWNDIRRLFAKTRESRAAGLKPGHFSFNSGNGRCSECKGSGRQEIRMNLLPDAEIPCPACHGRRFSEQICEVHFKGLNVHDVLDLRVDEALQVFSEIASTVERLRPFEQVGLGYMTLGQSAATWSGGEAQRMHLAGELVESHASSAMYVLDEPTRGLHHVDIHRLQTVLRQLVDKGHTVVAVEHNTQFLRNADWIFDMGPGAANDGGKVIASGTPQQLRNDPNSVTGPFL